MFSSWWCLERVGIDTPPDPQVAVHLLYPREQWLQVSVIALDCLRRRPPDGRTHNLTLILIPLCRSQNVVGC